METATLAGGCFWCLEATYNQLAGVTQVRSGYAGGEEVDPTYEAVCSGQTGHAEVVQMDFDPAEITYRDLLEVFFVIHDPTTLNRQGADIGTQYRSAIFFHSVEQEKVAREWIAQLMEKGEFHNPIVTEVEPLERFYRAEAYHDKYYELNTAQPYCQMVIRPKLDKLKSSFSKMLDPKTI